MCKYFDIWPDIDAIAKVFGVPYVSAASFAYRGEIPAKYDYKLLDFLQKAGRPVSHAALHEWHQSHATRRAKIRELGGGKSAAKSLPVPPVPWSRPVAKFNCAHD